ncbi:arylamine N-acetyltransferase family protein [Corynebacterium atypicum]|uniref:arylamine N-acetyltransferase family protein n=1 Tax=Corynebacterium atypicum TaxID=191610 RepID=UPI0006907573|nr:arylamine N-acetyltransferase [Corynebacterium atypicum]
MTDTSGTSGWNISAYNAAAYLEALGLSREEPSADYLARLHEAHVSTFPFTSVNVLLGDHPGVAAETIFEQVVVRRRGGYCLEHASLMAGVLEQLGFQVTRRFGRVHTADNSRSHMCLFVTVEGRTFLCDPGFGYSVRRPLEVAESARVDQGGREFCLERDGRFWRLVRDGAVQHIIDDLPVMPVDVPTTHEYLKTGFGSFSSMLMALRYTPEGHVTVAGTARTVRRDGEPTEHEKLTIDAAIDVVKALGVSLDGDRETRLHQVLESDGKRR